MDYKLLISNVHEDYEKTMTMYSGYSIDIKDRIKPYVKATYLDRTKLVEEFISKGLRIPLKADALHTIAEEYFKSSNDIDSYVRWNPDSNETDMPILMFTHGVDSDDLYTLINSEFMSRKHLFSLSRLAPYSPIFKSNWTDTDQKLCGYNPWQDLKNPPVDDIYVDSIGVLVYRGFVNFDEKTADDYNIMIQKDESDNITNICICRKCDNMEDLGEYQYINTEKKTLRFWPNEYMDILYMGSNGPADIRNITLYSSKYAGVELTRAALLWNFGHIVSNISEETMNFIDIYYSYSLLCGMINWPNPKEITPKHNFWYDMFDKREVIILEYLLKHPAYFEQKVPHNSNIDEWTLIENEPLFNNTHHIRKLWRPYVWYYWYYIGRYIYKICPDLDRLEFNNLENHLQLIFAHVFIGRKTRGFQTEVLQNITGTMDIMEDPV